MSNRYKREHIVFDLAALDTGGGVAAVRNPEGRRIFVHELIVDVTTKSTGACTINAGVASGATTSDDTLIDGLDVGTAAITASNKTTPGTNGLAGLVVAAGSYITISKATGAAAGLAGKGYLSYTVLD